MAEQRQRREQVSARVVPNEVGALPIWHGDGTLRPMVITGDEVCCVRV